MNQVRERGGIAVHVSGNLGHAERAVTRFHEAEGAVGPIDVLVHNAAHCELPDNRLEISADAVDRHFSVNTRAAVLLAREFARRFAVHRGTAGRIINISTDSASAFAGQIAYGAGKAALEASTRSLAIELGPADITVNAVAPEPTQTGWIDSELEAQSLPDVPLGRLGRLGRPEEIADAVVYLASRRADWITGHVSQVSGGHALQPRIRMIRPRPGSVTASQTRAWPLVGRAGPAHRRAIVSYFALYRRPVVDG